MTPPESTTDIPVLHRLAILYLVLPLLIWLVGWFEWWFGIPAAAAIAAGLWPVLSGSWRPPKSCPWRLILVLSAIALAWTMSTGAGNFLDTVQYNDVIPDWVKHRAVFADLARHPWPVHVPDDDIVSPRSGADLPDPLLRYYLGYYMAPGLVAKWFGIAALNWAVPLWTWAGVALLILCFAFSTASRTKAVIVSAVILVFFSGMDIVRLLALKGFADGWLQINLHPSIEWGYPMRMQYSSNTTGLMWVPQHFISAGLGAMLLIESHRRTRMLAVSGIVAVTILFWSPFVAVGLLPLVAVLLIENRLRPFLRWQNLLVAPLLAALLATYLLSDSAGLPHGWAWKFYGWELLSAWLPIFYLLEFLTLACFILVLRSSILDEKFFVASVLALLTIPFYVLGAANDLCMRVSLPSLIVLCWYTARALAGGQPTDQRAGGGVRRTGVRRTSGRHDIVDTTRAVSARKRRRRRKPARHEGSIDAMAGRSGIPRRGGRVPAILVTVVLVSGAFTPLVEMARAVVSSGVFRYQQMDYSVFYAAQGQYSQYGAWNIPYVLDLLLKDGSLSTAD